MKVYRLLDLFNEELKKKNLPKAILTSRRYKMLRERFERKGMDANSFCQHTYTDQGILFEAFRHIINQDKRKLPRKYLLAYSDYEILKFIANASIFNDTEYVVTCNPCFVLEYNKAIELIQDFIEDITN